MGNSTVGLTESKKTVTEPPFERLIGIINETETDALIEKLKNSIHTEVSYLIPDFAEVFSIGIQELIEIAFEKLNSMVSAPYIDARSVQHSVKTMILSNGLIVLWNRTPSALLFDLNHCRFLSYIIFLEKYNSSTFCFNDIKYSTKSNHLLFAGRSSNNSYHSLKIIGNPPLLPFYAGDEKLPWTNKGSDVVEHVGTTHLVINLGNTQTIMITSKGDTTCTINEPASSYAVSDYKWLAIGYNKDTSVKIYEYNNEGVLTFESKLDTKTYISALAITSNELIVTAGTYNYWTTSENLIQLWDRHGKLIDKFPPQHSLINQLLLLPNGWLCVVSDKVRIWNLISKKVELTYDGSHAQLTSDGNLSITSKDRIILINVSTEYKNRIIKQATNNNLPDNLKYKLYYLHNLAKRNIYQAVLSNQSLKDSDAGHLVKLLSFTNLTEVDLSYNLFESTGLEILSNLLSIMKFLKNLKLAGNRITNSELKIFSNIIEDNPSGSLESLDLSNNLIDCEATSPFDSIVITLKGIKNKLAHCTSLTDIDLSQNYLPPQADSVFVGERDKESIFTYSFFKTKPNSVKSQIDPQNQITKSQWIVTYSCVKSKRHAFILLEGMRDNGQLFMKTYEINSEDRIGKATINERRIFPQNYNFTKIRHQTFVIDNNQGNRLMQSIGNKLNKDVSFCLFAGSSIGRVNCSDWCIKELANIGIEVKIPIIPTPENIASQNNCNIS
jgi:hypothetical protein